MAEKDTKKALAEQRRRQQELIELKKLQQEGGGIPTEATQEVLTPTSKIKNFWYYYKYYILALVIIVMAFGFLVKQCADKIEYDYIVILNSNEYVSDADVAKIEDELKKHAVDTNDDGEIHLFVMNCSRTDGKDGNIQFNNAQTSKFQTQLLDGAARIFIMSEKLFEDCNKQDYMLWTDEFNLPYYDGKGLAIADTNLASVLEPYQYEYYIGYRKSENYDTKDAKLFESFIAEYVK